MSGIKIGRVEEYPTYKIVISESNVDSITDSKIVHFAKNIKYLRNKKRLSRKDMAKFIGISNSFLGMIERGERKPSIGIMIKACIFLDGDIGDMFMPMYIGFTRSMNKRIKPSPRRHHPGLNLLGSTKASFEEIASNFGENVRYARKERKYDSSDFASYTGISKSKLKLIEQGENIPTFEEVVNICDFLGEDIVEMLMPRRTYHLILDKATPTKPPNTKDLHELQREMAINMILELDEHELGDAVGKLKAHRSYLSYEKYGGNDLLG